MSPSRPDVSVVVVAYNARDELADCLQSIERHIGDLSVETILVDNASTDGTAELVAGRFPATRVIRRDRNEGVAARRHGLAVAQGAYRMFLDSDARLTPEALTELVRFMGAHAAAGLVGPRLVYPDGTPQPSARRFPPLLLPLVRRPPLRRFMDDSRMVRRHLMLDDDLSSPREVEYVLGACQLFSEEAQLAAGEFDSRIFYGPDDVEWCLRIREAGYEVHFDPGATVIHDYRRSTDRRPVSRLAVRHLWSFYRFQWRWRRRRRRMGLA